MNKNHIKHHEIVERYCHVIGANTPISQYTDEKGVRFECMNKHKCERNGGCKNTKFEAKG